MLKPRYEWDYLFGKCQPPSGGCVLKLTAPIYFNLCLNQPPSGGCVLKPTINGTNSDYKCQPPSGGCVLKQNGMDFEKTANNQPPSGGCVLKPCLDSNNSIGGSSRLQAAVC